MMYSLRLNTDSLPVFFKTENQHSVVCVGHLIFTFAVTSFSLLLVIFGAFVYFLSFNA